MREKIFWVTMAASFALLGIVRALTIDNQLTLIKNDCYERMAIGQRLSPKNVYKTFDLNTVADCQMACTKEKDTCKAFSFGISAKGNATCELSADHVKETADLKPINTLSETDFDLYIKKLGCKLVLEDPKQTFAQNGNKKPQLPDNFQSSASTNPYNTYPPSYGNQQRPPDHKYNQHPSLKPPNDYGNNEGDKVQTVVSVASGPQSFLHPVHEILVAERPILEQSPYGEHRPPGLYGGSSNAYGGGGGSSVSYGEQSSYAGSSSSWSSYGGGGSSGAYEEHRRPNYPDKRPFQSYGELTRPYREGYGESNNPPFRPSSLNHPYNDRPSRPRPEDYDNRPRPGDYDRPDPGYDSRPEVSRPLYGYGDERPTNNYRPSADRYDDRPPRRPFRPEPLDDYPRPNFDYYDRPMRPNRYGSYIPHPDDYDRPQPQHRPHYDNNRPFEGGYLFKPNEIDRYDRPITLKPSTNGYDSNLSEKPPRPILPTKPDSSNPNAIQKPNGTSKPIVTQSVGYHGEHITSIITPIKEACFRRALAGKRVSTAFVKRALICETVEECQRECADEKRFSCEGFNYRLDPTGRAKGECELIDVPLTRMDIGRDLYPDRDYDFYEKDRNAASISCKQRPTSNYYPHRPSGGGGGYRDSYGHGESGGSSYYHHSSSGGDRRYDVRRPYDYEGDRGLRRPADRWDEDDRKYPSRRPPAPADRRYDYGNKRPDDYDRFRPSGNRRGDYSYHQSHHSQNSYANNYHFNYHSNDYHRGDHHFTGIHYLPATDHQHPSYLPPKRPYDYVNRNSWGLNDGNWGSYGGSYGNFGQRGSNYGNHLVQSNRNRFDIIDRRNYLPPPLPNYSRPALERPKDWGMYGGSYGNGGGVYLQYNGFGHGHNNKEHGFDYWGFDKINGHRGGSYLPAPRPNYLPVHHGAGHLGNDLLPAEPRHPYSYDFLKDECSLRSATGFRLHKGIVKKFYAVPNIYECELLCFKEKAFPCASYAFRYTVSLSAPTDNCYLSNRNYKELDHYTDLEPDRDFDIYTMNNMNRCEQPIIQGKDNSDCFWRVRSGFRLDHRAVKDSLMVKSIVECQLECLRSRRFACRAYSYRYGSPVIGGAIDNCQLTDWPTNLLNPKESFTFEPGFEIYERASFGHGCEPNHFGIHDRYEKHSAIKVDQMCYIGFGSPARLNAQAVRKSLWLPTELDCRAECSKTRETTLFQCMSFSYGNNGVRHEPNCFLSDILQRDLLPSVDYKIDPDSWLFAWDNHNPECRALANERIHSHSGNHIENRHGYDIHHNVLDTWKVYSVSGWPCRRGTQCKENRETGFWFCELEGRDSHAWDYCCRPDHQCGASNGYPYQWCYVGPTRSQWRKCSERYYPYMHNVDRWDPHQNQQHLYLPSPPSHNYLHEIPAYRPGIHPNRPLAPPREPPIRPSLDEYEMQFDHQFLDPPKPGGFGEPRHWPVSYLHKEMPPNNTDSGAMLMMKGRKDSNPKFEAIQNLIDVIKNNDLQHVQYHIANESNKKDDILFVRIPLPTNFTDEEVTKKEDKNTSSTASSNLQSGVDLDDDDFKVFNKRSQKSLPIGSISRSFKRGDDKERPVVNYRRGFVERTNVTNYGRSFRNI